MSEIDFTLATTQEIIKELASRAKKKRKKNGTQKQFAEHIGISFRSYQEFEISGKITLEKFIDVLRGLEAIEDAQELLKIKDEALFEVYKNSKKRFI
ncbi:MAG: hypothetical protein PHR87_07030 [Sulfurospirillaceae bacterium]|nr:hypothetical protein [Sulfurospirillaceae bacterium]